MEEKTLRVVARLGGYTSHSMGSRTPAKFASYSGLIPSTFGSGGKVYPGLGGSARRLAVMRRQLLLGNLN